MRLRDLLRNKLALLSYRFSHWAFRWCQDDEGDICFVILGVIGFIKYKEHTIIEWMPKMESAGKYQGARQ